MSHSWAHQLLHIAILASTLMGGASLAMLVLWSAFFDGPLPSATRKVAIVTVVAAVLLYLLEWRVVHQR
ncbi:MAG TPA: hypothetical protein VFK89_12390 [Actinomycetota bacterium]|nr:hypothetical protein [Actinomycetota bacterium]